MAGALGATLTAVGEKPAGKANKISACVRITATPLPCAGAFHAEIIQGRVASTSDAPSTR